MFKVESGVPMPDGGASGARTKYPFGEMKVGDSFLVPPDGNMKSVRVGASIQGRFLGRKFSCRVQPCGSLRVWRIE